MKTQLTRVTGASFNYIILFRTLIPFRLAQHLNENIPHDSYCISAFLLVLTRFAL